MVSRVNNFAQGLLDALLPQRCALCGLASGSPLPLCGGCAAELPTNAHACTRCAIPLPPGSALRQCGSCQLRPPPYHRVVAPWLYGGYLGHLIHRWKYQGEFGMTALLANLWQQQATPGPVDLIVPVPLHWARQWRRGFNQSELLAQELRKTCAQLQGTQVDKHLLRRHRATALQSGSNARARARNLRGAFTVTRPCDNLRLAVVDDVLTTGATAAEVANALGRAGARHIEIWCIARTPPPGA